MKIDEVSNAIWEIAKMIFVSTLITIFVYMIFSFILQEIDYRAWTSLQRFFYLFAIVVFSILIRRIKND
jgi:hypothetical protein